MNELQEPEPERSDQESKTWVYTKGILHSIERRKLQDET